MKSRYLTFSPARRCRVARRSPAATRLLDARPERRGPPPQRPPPACTAEQMQAPARRSHVDPVPRGQEPVIDYSADCCAHFTCQPLSARRPVAHLSDDAGAICPAGTKLWIGTAIEDCCPGLPLPARRHRPAIRRRRCAAATRPTPRARWRCRIADRTSCRSSSGRRADCCPIYQCPCDEADRRRWRARHAAARRPRALCGCTYPNCQAGEELVCAGQDNCMGPCACRPARGICKDDSSAPPARSATSRLAGCRR